MRLGHLGAVTLALICCSPAAVKGSWPEKPLYLVVPFAPGSLTDVVPRIIFERVSAQVHQTIVVENRPGAGTTIAAAAVAIAKPNGYTILVNSNAQVVAPLLYPDISYDRGHDFTAVALLVTYPDVLVVASSKHIATLSEFLRAAKARKHSLTFASLGVGSATYMNAERFGLAAGYHAIDVPFKGALEAIREVMEGRVDYCFCGVGTTLPFIRQGKLLALAVSTQKRSPLLPDVPTTIEAGFPASDYEPWLGLFVPSHTPRELVERLHDEVAKALEAPQLREHLRKLGAEPAAMSTSEFDDFVEREALINKGLADTLGLRPH